MHQIFFLKVLRKEQQKGIHIISIFA